MQKVYANETVDPVLGEIYALEGSHDSKFLNWNATATFYLRGSKNMLLQGGKVGGTSDGRNCKIGAAYQSTVNCSYISIQDLTFHDITITPNSGQHNEAIAATGVDHLDILRCRFQGIYANTADVFFAFEQNPVLCTYVNVMRNYFGPPTNPTGKSAIQWKDNNGQSGVGFHDFAIGSADPADGNLFDGCDMTFGTLSRQVGNFTVGINYGNLSVAQHDYAVKMGVKFLEFPFRPASEWPGAGTPVPPVVIPPTDPCAQVKADLAAANAQLADTQTQLTKAKNDLATTTDDLAAANLKIKNAQAALA